MLAPLEQNVNQNSVTRIALHFSELSANVVERLYVAS